ncbi:MAG: ABC transporter permease [Chloroflexi bacterium]|nr:ABC transporter permease [Ktedonobacteraceae bacterium]MBV9707495.1 ABC transporter permease [Chloroflexota bacterium]
MNYLLQPYNYDLSDPASIPNLFLDHLYLVGITMLISLIIALPLGILVARRPRLYLLVITIADLLYTVPALALIAILITITGLSLATAIIPLVIYTQLVLIRNTATAINGIDPLLLEVGKAMGMNPRQVLLRVALPQALPTIIAGVRIATVTTIGIAALAYLAGQSGLGDLIFKNIATTDFDAVVAGGILIALLAVVADLLLLAVQTVLNRGRTSVSLA